MNYYEYIEEYHEGTLAASIKTSMESEMEADPLLAAAVKQYSAGKKIAEGLLEMDVMQTINTLSDIEANKNPPKRENDSKESALEHQPEKKSILKWLIAAALIGVLASAAYWLLSSEKSRLDKEEAWATYIKPTDLDATKSVDTIDMSLFQKGKHYFGLNEFKKSEYIFIDLIETATTRDSLSQFYFWLGAAHLEQWEIVQAKAAWEQSDEKGSIENRKMCDKILGQ